MKKPILCCGMASLLLGCALVLASIASTAEIPIKPGGELTLRQAIQIALRLHPRHQESVSAMRAAHEGIGVARSQLMPQLYGAADYLRGTINASANTTYLSVFGTSNGMFGIPRVTGANHYQPGKFNQSWNTENNYMGGLVLYQYLWDGGRVRGFIDQKRAEDDAAQATLKLTDLDLIFGVVQRYFGLLAAKQIVKVYEKAVEQRTIQLHEAETMAKANLKPQLDVYTTKGQLARAQLHLVDARNADADAKVALDNSMGLSIDAPNYHLTEQLSYHPVSETLKELLRVAFTHRPDLESLQDEVRAAGAQVAMYRSDYLPTAKGIGNYVGMGGGYPGQTPMWDQNFNVGVMVTWPMFNGFETTHQVAQTRYRKESVEHAVSDLEQHIYQQVTTALLDWQASVVAISRAQETLEASGVELKLADERYRAGLSNVVELEDAQRVFTADSAAYVNTLYRYQITKGAVDRNTGRALSMYGLSNQAQTTPVR